MNIGSSSILLVFVILCLVSFAVLSIVSANADSKLSARVLERTTAYYTACNQAEQSLAGMDNTLRRVYETSDSEDAYYASVGHGKSYVIPISDLQSLQVTIEVLYPASADDTFYRRIAITFHITFNIRNAPRGSPGSISDRIFLFYFTDCQHLFPLPQSLLRCSHRYSQHPDLFHRSGSVLHHHRTYRH